MSAQAARPPYRGLPSPRRYRRVREVRDVWANLRASTTLRVVSEEHEPEIDLLADPTYRDAVTDLLGVLAYAELVAFERLAYDARMAPTLEDKAALARLATAEFGHYQLLERHLDGMGVGAEKAMAPFVVPLEALLCQLHRVLRFPHNRGGRPTPGDATIDPRHGSGTRSLRSGTFGRNDCCFQSLPDASSPPYVSGP